VLRAVLVRDASGDHAKLKYMTSLITVCWVTAETWATVKTSAAQVLHEAGLRTNDYKFLRRRYPSNSEGAAIVENSNGEIVGVVTISVRSEGYNDQFGPFHGLPGPRAFVDEIGVIPSAQGAGVGRALMRAAAQEIRRRGALRLALRVDEASDQTVRRAFFASCGLWSLRPDRYDDLLGASVDEVLDVTFTHTAE
jgi:GNAT superfamily N-acetyltransferase